MVMQPQASRHEEDVREVIDSQSSTSDQDLAINESAEILQDSEEEAFEAVYQACHAAPMPSRHQYGACMSSALGIKLRLSIHRVKAPALAQEEQCPAGCAASPSRANGGQACDWMGAGNGRPGGGQIGALCC
jgi:hypothetical protein